MYLSRLKEWVEQTTPERLRGTMGKDEGPSGPIVNVMRQKYGESSVERLSMWTKEFGFPKKRLFQ